MHRQRGAPFFLAVGSNTGGDDISFTLFLGRAQLIRMPFCVIWVATSNFVEVGICPKMGSLKLQILTSKCGEGHSLALIVGGTLIEFWRRDEEQNQRLELDTKECRRA